MKPDEKETGEIAYVRNESLELITKAEIDMQISTAKAFPRDLKRVLSNIEMLATIDTETAEECHYVIHRGGKTIEGPSVRFAEIVANSWGNLRMATRVVKNDGKTVTVQGLCHDLESNLSVGIEVERRITDRFGKTFNEDMQVITGMAAASIAFRNSLFKVVPKSFTKSIQKRVRALAIGKGLDLKTAIQNMLANFKKYGVSEEQILNKYAIKDITEITADLLYEIKGVYNAIKDGVNSVDDAFPKTVNEKKEEIKEKKKAAKPGEQSKIDLP